MKKALSRIADRSQSSAATAAVDLAQLFPGPPNRRSILRKGRFWRRAWLPLLLLVASVLTICGSGARFMHDFQLGRPPLASGDDFFPLPWVYFHLSAFAGGWSFCLALLSILLAHEAGHFFYCRKHGIDVTWPYVLPAPTLSGTAEAVIRIRSRIPSRRALIEVGIAGPIAGYLVALPTTVVGLLLSRPAGSDSAPALVQFRWPLTVTLLDRALAAWFPWVPRMDNLIPHPILIASWVGLFVTSPNVMPAGQLDGGHILYAIPPRWHRRLTFVVPVLLLVMGVTLWTGWVLWGAILFLPAMRHPHVPYFPRLHGKHRWLCVLALAILLLTFLPAPFVGTSILDLFR